MKNVICLVLGFLVITPSFADSKAIAEHTEVEVEENERIAIKEIKFFVSTLDSETTCMDEYLKRRKQLILKLGLSPITIVAGATASFFMGGVTGAGLSYVTGAYNDWAGLGYVIGGSFLGAFAGGAAMIVDTTSGVKQLLENNLILKALAEYYMDRPGEKVTKLYNKVLKKTDIQLTEEEFLAWLVEQNESGKLCDGSFVKKPKIRLGPKLKYKVAKIKDLKKQL